MVINEDGLITENQNTLDNTQIDTEAISSAEDSTDKAEIVTEENFDLESNEQISNDLSAKEETANTNCLALTVRKSYNLSIVKNSIFTTLRVSWKVALSTFVLNILKLFFYLLFNSKIEILFFLEKLLIYYYI